MSSLHLVALSMAVSLNGSLAAAPLEQETRYQLVSGSWSGVVCELCSCPDTLADLHGTFVLRASGEEDGFQTFDVLGVEWKTTLHSQRVRVTGSGVFRHGGPSGREQILELDLRMGAEEMRVTSGRVEAERDFPDLELRLETSLEPICRDTVFFLSARPGGPDPGGGESHSDSGVGGTPLESARAGLRSVPAGPVSCASVVVIDQPPLPRYTPPRSDSHAGCL